MPYRDKLECLPLLDTYSLDKLLQATLELTRVEPITGFNSNLWGLAFITGAGWHKQLRSWSRVPLITETIQNGFALIIKFLFLNQDKKFNGK